MGTVIAQAVAEAFTRQPADFPAPVLDRARTCLVDAVRCVFEARRRPTTRQVLAAIHPCPDGVPVIGTDRRATPGEAAFAMGAISASLLREDMHAASISHHGIVVWPALLAAGASTGAGSDRLLAAGVVGYEFGAALGRTLFDAQLARKIRPTAFSATAGAAMGCAYLLELDPEAAAMAVALAVDGSAGLNQWPRTGGEEIFIQAGRAAQTAVTAVRLARAGAFASPDMIEGAAGLFVAAGKTAPARLPLFDGPEPAIMAVYNKALPICNFAQTPARAALDVASQEGFDSSAVVALHADVTEAAQLYPGCDHPGPYDQPLQAKMSIQFCVAAALAGQLADPGRFPDLQDPETLRLARLCALEAAPDLTAAFPARQGARIEAVLADGRVLRAERGDVTPATDAEVQAGLLRSAGEVVGAERASALAGMIAELPGGRAVQEILLAGSL